MNRALRRLAVSRHARGLPTIVVEVAATRGSAPREPGTRMLVWRAGTAGTIGGGNLEWRAIALARAMLADDALRPDDQSFSLGASLGQCCGGAVTLRHRVLDAASLAAWPDDHVTTIQLYGAGHVGRALAHVLGTLDVRVQWIDEREAEFPPEPSPPTVERVCVEPVEAEVDEAPAGSLFVVATHEHDLDLRIVEAILRRGDFVFLGLIGSATKRRRFEHLLRRRGFDDASLARITCPIGVDGITGKAPAHIAIAVAAQILPLVESIAAAVERPAARDA